MKQKSCFCILMILFLGLCTACSSEQAVSEQVTSKQTAWKALWKASLEELPGLTYQNSLELEYATGFSVDYYEDGFVLLSISDGSRFLLNRENKEIPEGMDENIVVLEAPVTDIYLAASAAMDMFCTIGAIDAITFSSLQEEGWYIPQAKQAMKEGSLVYAGKYNAPDYELIFSSGCKLAVESTMIQHSPEVKESLEKLGIPVLVDYSSYEGHPLGRTEWVKLYGVLTGREQEAEQAFAEQSRKVASITEDFENREDKKVAFFYITSSGAVSVRKSTDYVPKMIALAGGTYFYDTPDDTGNASSSVTLQMEAFYQEARDADYLIYNSTIEGKLSSLDELLEKDKLFTEFKAVQEGNVWCTNQNLYQSTMDTGSMIWELHQLLTTEEPKEDEFTYFYQLK